MSTLQNTQQEIATPDKALKHTESRSQKTFGTTKWLTHTAMFAALALVMKFIGQFLTLTPSFKITLIYTVWLIAAATQGIIGGAAVCFISDVLGAIIFPAGAINPLIILGNTLYGVLAGITFKLTPGPYAVRFIVEGIVCTLVCTCVVNTVAIWYWYKYYETLNLWQYYVGNRLLQPAVAAINIAITVSMIPLLMRIGLLPKHKKT